MLSISTLQEAMAFLSERTGRPWTESEILDTAVGFRINLRAVIPARVWTKIQRFEVGGLVTASETFPGDTILAKLVPKHIRELWLRGETTTDCPGEYCDIDGPHVILSEPVRVTLAEVRIDAEGLREILATVNFVGPNRFYEHRRYIDSDAYQEGALPLGARESQSREETDDRVPGRSHGLSIADNSTSGVSVTLPHVPKALAAVFQVMRNNWTDYDQKRVPKQVNIAREIDEALGWRTSGSQNDEPSRNAKAIAKLIKPDAIDDTK